MFNQLTPTFFLIPFCNGYGYWDDMNRCFNSPAVMREEDGGYTYYFCHNCVDLKMVREVFEYQIEE